MMRSRICLPLVFAVAMPSGAFSLDYGSFGALFPVEEPSVLDAIFARLHEMEGNGEMDAMRDSMQQTVRDRVARPLPVQGLTHAKDYRSYEVDLSITVKQDLSDHNGVVFARAGTVVNPLDYSAFSKRLVFIDGDNPEQVAFAVDLARSEPAKIILTSGSPLDLTEQHQLLFYFDQGGVISERFHLQAVPAVVSRGERAMFVEEIPMQGASE